MTEALLIHRMAQLFATLSMRQDMFEQILAAKAPLPAEEWRALRTEVWDRQHDRLVRWAEAHLQGLFESQTARELRQAFLAGAEPPANSDEPPNP